MNNKDDITIQPPPIKSVDLRFEFPVKYDEHGGQMVWTKDMQRLCDMRGWGFLTGTGGLHLDSEVAAEIQDARGQFVAKCINEHASLVAQVEKYKTALEQWKCRSCDGQRLTRRAGYAPLPCDDCEGTGLSPIARQALQEKP